MGETSPPLNELSARKRLAQAHMELHRAEMTLHYQQATAPLRLVQSRIHSVTSNPVARWMLLGGMGFMLVSKRTRYLRRATGWLLPFMLPRLRGIFSNRALQFGLKGAQFMLNRKGFL